MTDYSFNTIIDTSTLQIGQVVRINFTDEGIFRVFYNDSNGNMYCGLSRQSNYRQVIMDSAYKRRQLDISSSAIDYISLNKLNPPFYGGTYHEEQMRIPIDRNDKDFYVFKYDMTNTTNISGTEQIYGPWLYFTEITSQSYIKQGSTSGTIYNSDGYSSILASGKNPSHNTNSQNSIRQIPDYYWDKQFAFAVGTLNNPGTNYTTGTWGIGIPIPDTLDLYGQTINTITNNPLNTNYSYISNLSSINVVNNYSRFGIVREPLGMSFSYAPYTLGDNRFNSQNEVQPQKNISYTIQSKRPKYVWLDNNNNSTSDDGGNGNIITSNNVSPLRDNYYKGKFSIYAFSNQYSDLSGNIYIQRSNRSTEAEIDYLIFSNFANTSNLHNGDINNIFVDLDLDISKNSTIDSGNFNYIYSRPYYVICSDLSGQIVHGTVPYNLFYDKLPSPEDQHIVDISGILHYDVPQAISAKYCKIMVDPTSTNWDNTRYHIIYYAQGGLTVTDSHTKDTLRWISGIGKNAIDLCGNITTIENSGLYPSMDMSGNVPYVAYLCKGTTTLTDISGIAYSYLNINNWQWSNPTLIATKEDLGGDLNKYTDVSNNHPISLKISPYDYSIHICYQKFNTNGTKSIGYWSNSKNITDIKKIDMVDYLGIKSYGKTTDISAASVELFWDISQCNCLFSRDYTRLDKNGNITGLTYPEYSIKSFGYPCGGRIYFDRSNQNVLDSNYGTFVKNVDENNVITYKSRALDKFYFIIKLKTGNLTSEYEELLSFGKRTGDNTGGFWWGWYSNGKNGMAELIWGVHDSDWSPTTWSETPGNYTNQKGSTGYTRLADGCYINGSSSLFKLQQGNSYIDSINLTSNTNYEIKFYYDKSNYYIRVNIKNLDGTSTGVIGGNSEGLYEMFNVNLNGGYNIIDGPLTIGDGKHRSSNNTYYPMKNGTTIYKLSIYSTDISNIPQMDVFRNGNILEDSSGTNFSSFFDNSGNTGLDIEPKINKYKIDNARNYLNDLNDNGSSYEKTVALNDIYFLQKIKNQPTSIYNDDIVADTEKIVSMTRFIDTNKNEIWACGYKYNNNSPNNKQVILRQSINNGFTWTNIPLPTYPNNGIDKDTDVLNCITTFIDINNNKWVFLCGDNNLVWYTTNINTNILGNNWYPIINKSDSYDVRNFTTIYPSTINYKITDASDNWLFSSSTIKNSSHIILHLLSKSGKDLSILFDTSRTDISWNILPMPNINTILTHTFTSCMNTRLSQVSTIDELNAITASGPNQADCDSEYGRKFILKNGLNVVNGIQIWTVPFTGIYTFKAYGAGGGDGLGPGGIIKGGGGAILNANISLNKNDKIKILIGQKGRSYSTNSLNDSNTIRSTGAGGGGTFIVREKDSGDEIIIIAGGGGGGGSSNNFSIGGNATIPSSQTGSNGGVSNNNQYNTQVANGGNGGNLGHITQPSTGAGGGYSSVGANGTIGNGGASFVSGGEGGSISNQGGARGGFGGGGSVESYSDGQNNVNILLNFIPGGGGGGGYNGGNSGSLTNLANFFPNNGGGGGSFVEVSSFTSETTFNEGNGSVEILYLYNDSEIDELKDISYNIIYNSIKTYDNNFNESFNSIAFGNAYTGVNYLSDNSNNNIFGIVSTKEFIITTNDGGFSWDKKLHHEIKTDMITPRGVYVSQNTRKGETEFNHTYDISGFFIQTNSIPWTGINGFIVSDNSNNYDLTFKTKGDNQDISSNIKTEITWNPQYNSNDFWDPITFNIYDIESLSLSDISDNNYKVFISDILNSNSSSTDLKYQQNDITVLYGDNSSKSILYKKNSNLNHWQKIDYSIYDTNFINIDNYNQMKITDYLPVDLSSIIVQIEQPYNSEFNTSGFYMLSRTPPVFGITAAISEQSIGLTITGVNNASLNSTIYNNPEFDMKPEIWYLENPSQGGSFEKVQDNLEGKKFNIQFFIGAGIFSPKPGTYYQFKVRYYNKYGYGGFSDLSEIILTPNIVPDIRNLNVRTSLVVNEISWEVFKKNDKQTVFNYDIIKQDISGISQFPSFSNEDSFQKDTIIRNNDSDTVSIFTSEYQLRDVSGQIGPEAKNNVNLPYSGLYPFNVTLTGTDISRVVLYDTDISLNKQYNYIVIAYSQGSGDSRAFTSLSYPAYTGTGMPKGIDISYNVNDASFNILWYIDSDISDNTSVGFDISWNDIDNQYNKQIRNVLSQRQNYVLNNKNINGWKASFSDLSHLKPDISYNFEIQGIYEGKIYKDTGYTLNTHYSKSIVTYDINEDGFYGIKGFGPKDISWSNVFTYYNYQESPILHNNDVSYNLTTNKINIIWSQPLKPSIPQSYDISITNLTSIYDISYNFNISDNYFIDNGLEYYPGTYSVKVRAKYGTQIPNDISFNSVWSNQQEFIVPIQSINNFTAVSYNDDDIIDITNPTKIILSWDSISKCNLSSSYGINIPDEYKLIRTSLPDNTQEIYNLKYFDISYNNTNIDKKKIYIYDLSGIYNGNILLDNTPPSINVVTIVPTQTINTSPQYTFYSTEAGNITISGATSSTTTANVGENTITFDTLPLGTYNNITITVTDNAGNESNLLTVNEFNIYDSIFDVTSNGTSGYLISENGIQLSNGGNNPQISLQKGKKYLFNISNASTHPFNINENNTGTIYSSGIIGQGTSLLTFSVPQNAPSNLYYQCGNHAAMQGNINIT
jgi:hypothetical protein